MATITWLHLTDLHQGLPGQKVLYPAIGQKFYKDLEILHKKINPIDLVLFTGDLTQGHKNIEEQKEQFRALDKTLQDLWGHLAKLGSYPKLLAVPGNHDLLRPPPINPLVKALKLWNSDEDIQQDFWNNKDSEYRQVVIKAFAQYQEWLDSTTIPKLEHSKGLLPGDFLATFEKDGLELAIVGLNSSFLQLTGENYEEKLDLNVAQLQSACVPNLPKFLQQHHASILMTHHPFQWLSKQALSHFNENIYISGGFLLHAFGHMHQPNQQTFSTGGSQPRRYLQGASLFGLETCNDSIERIHGYSIVSISAEPQQNQGILEIWPRIATKNHSGSYQLTRNNHFDLNEDSGSFKEIVQLNKSVTNFDKSTNPSAINSNSKTQNITPTLSIEQTLKIYLEWVIEQHSTLQLPAVKSVEKHPTVPLEKVYVALKGDSSSYYERMQARELTETELKELYEKFDEHSLEERILLRHRLAARQGAIMTSLRERDRNLSGTTITLGEAFQKERWLVILGDPGSGKTTLARWLAFNLAKTLNDKNSEVQVFLRQVDPDSPDNQKLFSLGFARLPVMIRVSEFAEWKASNKDGHLIEFLGYHSWLGTYAYKTNIPLTVLQKSFNDLIKAYLTQEKAVIILDGLDEISAADKRDDIVSAIKNFIKYNVKRPNITKLDWPQALLSDQQINPSSPIKSGGNQIIITSRIAGYHISPIDIKDVSHFTVEPMRRPAIEHFCDSWTRAVITEEKKKTNPEIEQLILETTTGLKKAIYSKENKGAQEIATNPLLITILALIYYRKGFLPTQRAELYETALQLLIEVWRKTEMSREQIVFILSPLAHYIHQHYSTGLIEESELKEKIKDRFYIWEKIPTDTSSDFLDKKINIFVEELREKVGLIAARGDRLYGFLHLTFQEYLAGRFLISDKKQAAKRLTDKLSDPRWRESILLALSYVNLKIAWTPKEREDLLMELLNFKDPLGKSIPRTTLIIAESLSEVTEISLKVVQEIVTHLLNFSANKELLEQYQKLKTRVRNALIRIRHKYAKIMDDIFVKTLSNPTDQDLLLTTATIIYEQKWFSSRIVKQLLEALPYDDENWDWPIDKSLRELVFKESGFEVLKPRKPEPPTDSQDIQQIHHYNIAQDVYARYEEKWQLTEYVSLPISTLKFRQALEGDEELLNQITSNPAWLSLVTMLYGGYYYYNADTLDNQYAEISDFLQKPDKEREFIISQNPDFYYLYFGYNDIVYNAAVVLDTVGKKFGAALKVKPKFEPKAIYRGSPLTDKILETLKDNQTINSLIDKLWHIWQKSEKSEERSDALVGLLALGVDITPELAKAFQIPENSLVASKVLRHIKRTSNFLKDPVARTGNLPAETKIKLESVGVEPELCFEIFQILARTLVKSRKLPVDFSKLDLVEDQKETTISINKVTHQKINNIYQAAMTADKWFKIFVGYNDDAVDNLARVLGNLPENKGLVEALFFAYLSPNRRWGNYRIQWNTPKIPFGYNPNTKDIPLDVFQTLSNLDLEHISLDLSIGFQTETISRLQGYIVENPNLWPEILAYIFPNDPIWTINRYPKLFLNSDKHDPFLTILDEAKKLTSSYHKARALIRLALYIPEKYEEIIQEAIELIQSISNTCLRIQVFELLVTYFPNEQKEELNSFAFNSAKSIKPASERSRVMARLALIFPEKWQSELTREAINAASEINETYERTEIFSLLIEHLNLVSESALNLSIEKEIFSSSITSLVKKWFSNLDSLLIDQLNQALSKLNQPWLRAKALNRFGISLLRNSPTPLFNLIENESERWVPMLLSAANFDVLSLFERNNLKSTSAQSLWQEMANNPNSKTLRNLVDIGIESGLQITHQAAKAINILIKNQKVDFLNVLLPLMEKPLPEAIKTVQNWSKNPNDFISSHAVLYLSEHNRNITTETIPKLVKILSGDHDRSRYRGILLLASNMWELNKKDFKVSLSSLGYDALILLIKYSLEFRYKDIEIHRNIRSIFSDLMYDDPQILKKLADDIANSTSQKDAATCILQEIYSLPSEVWDTVIDILKNYPLKVKKALFNSICCLAQIKTHLPVEVWDKLIPTLKEISNDLSGLKVLESPEIAIVEVVQELSRNKINDFDEAIRKADELLSKKTKNLSQIVNLKEEQLKTTFSSIGSSRLVWLNGTDPEAEDAAILLEETPEAFPLLLKWLISTLEKDINDDIFFQKTHALLTVCAETTKKMPDSFANHTNHEELEPLLCQAFYSHETVYGRRAALKLLSYLRRVTPEVAQIVISSFRSDKHIQETALESVTRFRRIDGNILPILFEGLTSKSAMVAYGAAKLLSTLGRSERLPPEQRKEILEKLAETLESPNTLLYQGVYMFFNDGVEKIPVIIKKIARLDQSLYEALLEVSGMP